MMIDLPGSVKTYKADFFSLEALNLLPKWRSLLDYPWLPRGNGARLLEWIGRYTVLSYLAERSPEIRPADLAKYAGNPRFWPDLFMESISHKTDNGHLVKAVRALMFGSQVTENVEGKNELLVKDDCDRNWQT